MKLEEAGELHFFFICPVAMEKPSKVGRRDETERIKGSQSWSEGRSEGRYGRKEGGTSRWKRPMKAAAAAAVGGQNKSLKTDIVFCSDMDQPSWRAAALEEGQRSESAKWAMSRRRGRRSGLAGQMTDHEETLALAC